MPVLKPWPHCAGLVELVGWLVGWVGGLAFRMGCLIGDRGFISIQNVVQSDDIPSSTFHFPVFRACRWRISSLLERGGAPDRAPCVLD